MSALGAELVVSDTVAAERAIVEEMPRRRTRVPMADLQAQYFELQKQIDAAIAEVIESGRFSGGDRVTRLEDDIATLCGARYGIGVASGTDALTLSLLACGIGAGDEVITTPFTFGATSEAILHVGATPVYVDIDLCTCNIDIAQIEAKITPRTRAILPVDLYGQMVDREALIEIAHRHDLKLIADAAQAIGATQKGRKLAEGVDAATLSFYPTKNLGAFGDGGMVLTSNDEVAAAVRSLRGHGTGRHKYYYERVGFCSRLDAIQAAVLEAKLPRLHIWNEGRRRNALLYCTLLGDLAEQELILPRAEDGNYHIYHQFIVRHPRRDALKEFLKEHNIDTEIYYPLPLHLHPAYAHLGHVEGDFPHAERVAEEVLALPIHPELTTEQIEWVATCVRRFLS